MIASASLKLVSKASLLPADCKIPRRDCLGLIEARSPVPYPIRDFAGFRGVIASASLKHRVAACPGRGDQDSEA